MSNYLRVQRVITLVTVALVSLTSGCQHHAVSPPSPKAVTGSNLSPQDAGRAIYTSTCTECHSAKSVSAYSLSDWTNTILPDMANRAHLSSTDRQNVLAYIQSVLNASP